MYSIPLKCRCCILAIAFLYSCNNSTRPEAAGTSTVAESKPAEEPEASGSPPLLFVQKCASCHGDDGTAGIGNAANLQKSLLKKPAIIKVINEGRGGMPAFKDKLSDEEIKELADFVDTLNDR